MSEALAQLHSADVRGTPLTLTAREVHELAALLDAQEEVDDSWRHMAVPRVTLTLHFVGGPLDGQIQEHPDAPPTVHVPSRPAVCRFVGDGDELPLPTSEAYERRPGVVAGEAVYDWTGRA